MRSPTLLRRCQGRVYGRLRRRAWSKIHRQALPNVGNNLCDVTDGQINRKAAAADSVAVGHGIKRDDEAPSGAVRERPTLLNLRLRNMLRRARDRPGRPTESSCRWMIEKTASVRLADNRLSA